jgi:protein TonB
MLARDRIGPLLLSLGVHATVIAVLLARPLLLAPEPLEPLRLVFVEPPPPPPPPAGVPGGTASATAPAQPATPKPVVVPRKPTPKPVVRPKTPVPPTARRPAPPKPAEPAAAAPAGSSTGEASSAASGKARGQAGGRIGGVIGGTGTGVPRANEVAVPPIVLRRVPPRYPRKARASGANGLVLLEAILDRDGHVEQPIRVLRSVPMLDDAAVEALRQWRFRPARDHRQQTVRVVLEVPMRFVLE